MAHGDFDSYRIMELVCGNPHATSHATDEQWPRFTWVTAQVFYGQPGGWPDIIDFKAGNLPDLIDMRILQTDAGAASDTLCYGASAGLIDEDDHVDLIINEMTGNRLCGTPVDVGNMFILSGAGMGNTPAVDLSFWNGDLLGFGSLDGDKSVTRYAIVRASSELPPTFPMAIFGPEPDGQGGRGRFL